MGKEQGQVYTLDGIESSVRSVDLTLFFSFLAVSFFKNQIDSLFNIARPAAKNNSALFAADFAIQSKLCLFLMI